LSSGEKSKKCRGNYKNSLLCNFGSVKLKKEGGHVLDKLTYIIKLMPEGSRVDVQGNADNSPIKTSKYP